MPSSRPTIIPSVVHWLLRLNPQSILDVGVGFGKWGHLFREYTDIVQAAQDIARYERANWKVRIDGIEGHAAYMTEMHRFLYNNIYTGDAAAILPTLPAYDLIFFGDIIEHFTKRDGLELLRQAIAKSNKAVIISTPKFDTAQGACFGNELERHRSLWQAGDFQSLPGGIVKTIDGDMLVAVILKPAALAELRRLLRRPFLRKLMPSCFIDRLLWGRPR
jgi:hypothetical protein